MKTLVLSSMLCAIMGCATTNQNNDAKSSEKVEIPIVKALRLAMEELAKSEHHNNSKHKVRVWQDGEEWNIQVTYLPATPGDECLVVVSDAGKVEVLPLF